jgi:adenosylcobinamide kinase/adenosylcobinamide-phosphate guanylyltransferase
MEVVLLGTGAAEGWPAPFCWCASCQAQRARREVRVPTAALVDDLLLLDGGPDALWAAERAGHPLTHLRAVLLTGDGPGPLALSDPSDLLQHAPTRPGESLTVAGPPGALAKLRHLTRPDRSVRLVRAVRAVTVRAGDRLDFGSHAVEVLAAASGSETVLFDLSGPAGDRLLYAGPRAGTDPLPQPTLTAVAGAAYDLALLDLDLAAFPAPLLALRECGAVVDQTEVLAVHLGHRNPPNPELARRMAAWGATTKPDGTVLRVGQPAPARARNRRAPRRVLVIGGARSGKSAEAEQRLAAEPDVIYVATGGSRADDAEWATRIAAHQARRPASWRTVETIGVAEVLAEAAQPVLIDCLTLWLAAVLDESGAWSSANQASIARLVDDRIAALVAAWRAAHVPVVAVTNEVGSGIVPATAAGRRFRDDLGQLNQRIAAESDEVVLMVAGLALPLRGER